MSKEATYTLEGIREDFLELIIIDYYEGTVRIHKDDILSVYIKDFGDDKCPLCIELKQSNRIFKITKVYEGFDTKTYDSTKFLHCLFADIYTWLWKGIIR